MKRGTPQHPKIDRLCMLLKIGMAPAVGYLELLWHFTAEFAPRGDVGRFSDGQIEDALHWLGWRGHLISALISSSWLDHHPVCRLCVHDWADHADDAVRKRLSRSNLQFVQVSRKVPGQQVIVPRSPNTAEPSFDDRFQITPEPDERPSAKFAASSLLASFFDISSDERQELWWRVSVRGEESKVVACEAEGELERVSQRIQARHSEVQRCGITVVREQLRAIVRSLWPEVQIDALRCIDQNHARWCRLLWWCKHHGRYTSDIKNWLSPNKGLWHEPPVL